MKCSLGARTRISAALRCGTWLSLACVLLTQLISMDAVAAEDAWRVPRLDHGQPDLQGRWISSNATPLVRPAGIDTLIISPQQAAAIDAQRLAKAEDRTRPAEPPEFFDERRIERVGGELRSSIIVDPPTGTLPGTALFTATLAQAGAAVLSGMDGPEQRPTSERCLGSLGSQAPMLSTPGANVRQIVQTDRTLVFMSEENHAVRIVRLDALHRPASITSWDGDSVGWWEGQTLVVETKYFTPSDGVRSNGQSTMLVSPQTVVVEHFRRISHEELSYTFTVDDPSLYTQRWTGETHFLRTDAPLLEYACHEGNYSMRFVLQGARAADGTLDRS